MKKTKFTGEYVPNFQNDCQLPADLLENILNPEDLPLEGALVAVHGWTELAGEITRLGWIPS